METRNQILHDRLVDLMQRLNGPDGKRKGFRNRIGALATRLASDAGTRNWADLKARADGPTYDSLLRMFQRESEIAKQADDDRLVDALEVLALSLISRRQQQPELAEGVALLDAFIDDSEKAAAIAKTQVVTARRVH